jgi:hypothetical protein
MISVEYEKLLSWGFIPQGECLISRATRNKSGYRVISIKKRLSYAHRVSYTQWFGDIPQGYVIDHECHNHDAALGLCSGGNACFHRSCINPDHLAVKLPGENLSSSALVQQHYSRGAVLTHCKMGHEFTKENTYTPKSGSPRHCRECRRTRLRSYYWAKKDSR